jgi:tetratricopeptide (TPR) repeat protein
VKSGLKGLLVTALVLGIPSFVSAQTEGDSHLPIPTGRNSVLADRFTGSITVYLRGENESPISATPQITLTSETDDTVIPEFPRLDGTGWVLGSLPIGNVYDLDISVIGYQPAHQTVELSDIPGAVANVVVNLKPIDQQLVFHPPAGQFILAPRAQKEVQDGLRDLRSNKVASAQKHFQRAIALAPGNPYVNYVMGMSYLLAKQELKAQPYLEESVSLDPNQVASLLALGTVRFDQSNYAGAIDVLTKGVKLDPDSWKSQWLLAASYLKERDFLEARDHAEKALVAGKQEAEGAKLVLAEAAAGVGDQAGAFEMVYSFLSDHPNNPEALALRSWLASLPNTARAMPKTTAQDAQSRSIAPIPQIQTAAVPASTPSADLPPKPDWAPLDIDEQKPYIETGASCSLSKVLKSAGGNAVQLASELEKFSAVEEYQTVEIKRDASLEKPLSRSFNYIVFIEHPRVGIIQVDEFRDEGVTAEQMPGELGDRGAPGLVLVFHPLLQGDFAWSCEGLGEWQHKPAWVVRFEQRPDRPNRLLTFQSATGAYPLPVKGRAWVAEHGGEVLHLDTDLITSVPQINLRREHFAIDYQAVTFPKHKTTLWLPESVNAYFQYRDHYYHNYHHFSQFQLFSVDASQRIGQPKETGQTKEN